MQAQENNLRKLLESNAQQYLVPLFQRFYVWGKLAWQRLWDDLTELLDEADAPGNLTPFRPCIAGIRLGGALPFFRI